jgi:hypothetical protein
LGEPWSQNSATAERGAPGLLTIASARVSKACRLRLPANRMSASGRLKCDLDTALAGYGRQRDQCAIPRSDANLRVARLDMATAPLGAARFQMTELEQALDDPAAVSDQPPTRRTLSSTTQINH